MSNTVAGIEVSSEDPTVRFEFVSKVGEGSYGAVYKAIDKTDGMIVAVKILELPDEKESADLRKEINFLRQCSSPYIVAYRGAFVRGSKIWIVMEYCGAGSLSDIMAICDVTFEEFYISAIMKQCLRGLDYLHKTKKLHRDIKSGNILLTHDGMCKLADFGVSAELANTLAKAGTMIGTPYFMAPEVLQSKAYDGKADIWSLGITAYELAVGQPPHADVHPMRAIFIIPTAPPPTLPDPESFSPEFKDFIRVCLQVDPANRPSAAQLLDHPFIKPSQEHAVVKTLVEEVRKIIEEYRDAEAREQQELKINAPGAGNILDNGGHGSAASGPTMVNNSGTMVGGSTGTMVGPSKATWSASDQGTVVANAAMLASFNADPEGGAGDMATMVPTGKHNAQGQLVSNASGTMVLSGSGAGNANEYSTMVKIKDAHPGTMVRAKGKSTGTLVLRKPKTGTLAPPAEPPQPTLVRVGAVAKLVESTKATAKTPEQVRKAIDEIKAMYAVDQKAVTDFYTEKLRELTKHSNSLK